MNDYFSANPTSAWFMVAAVTAGTLVLIGRAMLWAMAEEDGADLRRLEREAVNRGRQMFWSWAVLVADGECPKPTRRISEREWRGASADIQRELAQREDFEGTCTRG